MSILLIVLFIGFVLLLGLGFTHKIIPFQAVRWLLVGYFGILSISYVASFFVPENQVLSKHMFFGNQEQEEEYFSFYELVKEGMLEETDTIEVVKEWSFSYEGATLSLKEDHMHHVMIERKPEADGLIEVTHYKTKGLLDGKIAPISPIVSQTDTVLNIYDDYNFPQKEVKFALNGRDFVTNQFAPDEKIDVFGNHYFRFSNVIWENLIYVKIPENVELDEEFQYYLINEEN